LRVCLDVDVGLMHVEEHGVLQVQANEMITGFVVEYDYVAGGVHTPMIAWLPTIVKG
jgi:hypothetical protein